MKNKGFIAGAIVLLAVASLAGCKEEGRLDQKDTSDRIPSQVIVGEVEPIAGGVIINFECPDDDYLYAVRVEYNRNGTKCEYMASRYERTLRVEGLSSTDPCPVEIFSVGRNKKTSEPIRMSVVPGVPAIQTVRFAFSEVFGGVRVDLTGNDFNSELAVVLLRDTVAANAGKPLGEMDWEEVTTFHTSSSSVALTQRNLPSEKGMYAVYARDRWGNRSDTLAASLTPILEYELPRVGQWQIYSLPSDETTPLQYPSTLYIFNHWFDGKSYENQESGGVTYGPRDRWVTIDMGYVASFSRHVLRQRGKSAGRCPLMPWHWQIWGSMEPNPDGSWDDSWFLLGDFITYKPSGVLPDGSGAGTFTAEDIAWMRDVNEYDFVSTEQIADPQRECRYFRIRFKDTLASYYTIYDEEPNNIAYLVGEIILYGTRK